MHVLMSLPTSKLSAVRLAMSGVDTSWTQSDSKGFNHQRLDEVDLTRRVKKKGRICGRLTEPMGASGYWFWSVL